MSLPNLLPTFLLKPFLGLGEVWTEIPWKNRDDFGYCLPTYLLACLSAYSFSYAVTRVSHMNQPSCLECLSILGVCSVFFRATDVSPLYFVKTSHSVGRVWKARVFFSGMWLAPWVVPRLGGVRGLLHVPLNVRVCGYAAGSRRGLGPDEAASVRAFFGGAH